MRGGPPRREIFERARIYLGRECPLVVVPSLRELTLFHRLSASPNPPRVPLTSQRLVYLFRRELDKIEFWPHGQA